MWLERKENKGRKETEGGKWRSRMRDMSVLQRQGAYEHHTHTQKKSAYGNEKDIWKETLSERTNVTCLINLTTIFFPPFLSLSAWLCCICFFGCKWNKIIYLEHCLLTSIFPSFHKNIRDLTKRCKGREQAGRHVAWHTPNFAQAFWQPPSLFYRQWSFHRASWRLVDITPTKWGSFLLQGNDFPVLHGTPYADRKAADKMLFASFPPLNFQGLTALQTRCLSKQSFSCSINWQGQL